MSQAVRRPRVGTFAALLLMAWPGWVSAQSGDVPELPLVVTSGEAVVKHAPDQAFVTVQAESRARSPQEAQQQNAQAMTEVHKRLAAAGVPKDAVRTLAYSVQPEYDYVDGRQRLRGYVARNAVEVRVDDLTRVGEIADLAVASGATTVGGIRFELKNRREVEREALRLAVLDARARADALAAGAGRAIERVVRIEEHGRSAPPPRPMAMRAEMAGAAPETPIVAGEIEVRATVTLTATLK